MNEGIACLLKNTPKGGLKAVIIFLWIVVSVALLSLSVFITVMVKRRKVKKLERKGR